jgi:hypothetical protein
MWLRTSGELAINVELELAAARESSRNEAVQIDRAASTPAMSTIKSDTTLAITFPFVERDNVRFGRGASVPRRDATLT